MTCNMHRSPCWIPLAVVKVARWPAHAQRTQPAVPACPLAGWCATRCLLMVRLPCRHPLHDALHAAGGAAAHDSQAAVAAHPADAAALLQLPTGRQQLLLGQRLRLLLLDELLALLELLLLHKRLSLQRLRQLLLAAHQRLLLWVRLLLHLLLRVLRLCPLLLLARERLRRLLLWQLLLESTCHRLRLLLRQLLELGRRHCRLRQRCRAGNATHAATSCRAEACTSYARAGHGPAGSACG